MFSIDQNCHSLWDVIPKLHALAGRGVRVTHFVEDIDTAFTAIGSGDDAGRMRIARERYYRSGGADWGAAIFYSEFLGRLPADIRRWESLTGIKTKALANQLGRSVDDLYDEFSPGDNWQLIGRSYAGDGEHRVVGDLTVEETAPFLREIMDRAEADTRRAFIERDCRRRIDEWFSRERILLDRLLAEHARGRLVALYRHWLGEYLGRSIAIDLTSSLLAVGADPARTAVLDIFTRDYARAAALYNEAIEESGVELRKLSIREGELPIFAVHNRDGRWSRSPVHMDAGQIRVNDSAFALGPEGRLPTDELRAAGVVALAGKAVLLVIQVRLDPGGAPLAVPYRGSLYLPAAHLLAKKLAAPVGPGLPGPLRPLVRVRLRLLERMRSLDTTIRLPAHLASAFGTEQVTAKTFADNHVALAGDAARRLASFKDPTSRDAWQRRAFAELFDEIDQLDGRRRQLARENPKSPEIRDVWKSIKRRQVEILDGTVRQIAIDWQVSDVDYWDSRGAPLPWCIALGGEAFYNEVIEQAEIYEEAD